MPDLDDIKLTQYSHGAGCGCKIAPQLLDRILHSDETWPAPAALLVGNSTRDDAAVLALGKGEALISTTDFFMPIVDDPFDFGRIASANAISDVYAMGGRPVLAIAVLGWPVAKLSAEVARRVIEGSRSICREAGIALAGGHSIDSPEPIFGLAVNGIVAEEHLKQNNTARDGDLLFLSKALGVGILATAEKKGLLRSEDIGKATASMTRLNNVGAALGQLEAVRAMTDVTGFGLLGHLREMCVGSGLAAQLDFKAIPTIVELEYYLERKAVPGGSTRNWDSYGSDIGNLSERERAILCDPQTSGGLLVAVAADGLDSFRAAMSEAGLQEFCEPIGRMTKRHAAGPLITIS